MNIEKETVKTPRGDVEIYTLTNASGASVKLSSLGAGIMSIIVPDNAGNKADVVLGYADPSDYIADGPCAGKTPGRYANRIAEGKLTIDGKLHQLAINNGPNHLHGGPDGFQNHIWDSRVEGDVVEFSRRSPDGEENYPGNLDVKVGYRWSDDNRLDIQFTATTDAPTAVNLTNHTYFNLEGHGSGSVLDHNLRLFASRWLPTDDTLIPDGTLAPVDHTPMDFRETQALGAEIKQDFPALKFGKGYDNCWAVDGWQPGLLCDVAELSAPDGSRRMLIVSDQPGVQVYTGNWLTGSPKGKDGVEYNDYDCVAIECQGFPDAPNRAEFPTQILRPGEKYQRQIAFIFS